MRDPRTSVLPVPSPHLSEACGFWKKGFCILLFSCVVPNWFFWGSVALETKKVPHPCL